VSISTGLVRRLGLAMMIAEVRAAPCAPRQDPGGRGQRRTAAAVLLSARRRGDGVSARLRRRMPDAAVTGAHARRPCPARPEL